jgi:hypothetical protein
MPHDTHDIYPLQGVLAQQIGMLAKIQTAFRHFFGLRKPGLSKVLGEALAS